MTQTNSLESQPKLPNPRESLAALALVGAALIFGTTFATVKGAIKDVDIISFLSARFFVGAIVMVPLVALQLRKQPLSAKAQLGPTLRGGTFAGAALMAGYWFQTQGLRTIDEPTSAFVTYLLLAFVPLIGAVMLKRLPQRNVIIGVIVALGGLYLISGAKLHLNLGVGLTLCCAFAFAVHILVLDRFSGRVDPVALNLFQLLFVALGCGAITMARSGFHFSAKTWVAIVYLGVVASALAFFLQTWAQSHLDSSRSAALLMLEPVFTVAFNVILGKSIDALALFGGLVILVGIIVIEFPKALGLAK